MARDVGLEEGDAWGPYGDRSKGRWLAALRVKKMFAEK